MNRQTKKIRKTHRLYQNPQKNLSMATEIEDFSKIELSDETQLELMTSCLSNMQSNLEESKFYEVVNGEVVIKLIDCLKHSNPQIVVNALFAFQNLFRIANSYEAKKFEQIALQLNLISALEALQQNVCNALQLLQKDENLAPIVCALLNLFTEFFETCSKDSLKILETSSFFNGSLRLIVMLIQKPPSEAAFIQLMHYLQVLSESIPRINELFSQSEDIFAMLMKILQWNIMETDTLLQTFSSELTLKIRSQMIIVVFNILLCAHRSTATNIKNIPDAIKNFKNAIGELITKVLVRNIFREAIDNFTYVMPLISQPGSKHEQIEEVQSQTTENQVEEVKDLDSDKQIKLKLTLWLNAADAIIEQLKFLSRIYEGEDFEEEEILEEEDYEIEVENQKQQAIENIQSISNEELNQIFPFFFQPAFIQEVFTLVTKSYYSLQVYIEHEPFFKLIEGSQFHNRQVLQNLHELISTSLATIQNISHIMSTQMNQPKVKVLLEGLHNEVETLITKQSIIFEDKEDLTDLLANYIKCMVALFQNAELLNQVPEDVFLRIGQILFFGNMGIGEAAQLHFIELFKLRYGVKIKQISIITIQLLTDCLLNIVKQSKPLVAAQALDCFFDVYTEEDYNQILIEKNILPILLQGYEFMKTQIPSLKKQMDAEDFSFLKVTVANIKHFIQYKKKVMNIP